MLKRTLSIFALLFASGAGAADYYCREPASSLFISVQGGQCTIGYASAISRTRVIARKDCRENPRTGLIEDSDTEVQLKLEPRPNASSGSASEFVATTKLRWEEAGRKAVRTHRFGCRRIESPNTRDSGEQTSYPMDSLAPRA